MRARGACLCGALELAIAGPYRWFAHCHCSLCRKQYGTLFGTSLGVAAERFEWIAGASSVVGYRASAAFERPFCRHCGAKAPALAQDGRTWNVPAGLLLDDPGARPRSHIFVGSKATFAAIGAMLVQHAAYPPGFAHASIELPARETRGAPLEGSCLCDRVAFEATLAPHVLVHCHCPRCRRSRGGAFASTIPCAAATFAWLRGRERIRRFTRHGERYVAEFCADCGSPVPVAAADAPFVLVPAGAIDTPFPSLPAIHVHANSKPGWSAIEDAWPRFAARPPAERADAAIRAVTARCEE